MVHDVVGLPWVQDSVTELERDVIRSLYWTTTYESALTPLILTFDWLKDGIDELEADAVDNLGWIGRDDVVLAQSTVALSWVQDGITVLENEVLDELGWYYSDSLEVALSVVASDWVQDGIEQIEAGIISHLNRFEDAERPGLILALPWVQDGIEDTDDETAMIVAALAFDSAEEIQPLLDLGLAAVETKSFQTNFTDELRISLVRADGQDPIAGTIDIVAEKAQFVEEITGRPLPTSHIIYVLAENAPVPNAAGTNYGIGITMLPEYETSQADSSEHTDMVGITIHEIAHYFFGGDERWISEGMATMFEYFHARQSGLSHGQMKPHRGNCEAHDLQMFSDPMWDPELEEDVIDSCPYYLGELLFQDLYVSIGHDAFIAAMRELYQLILDGETRLPEVRQVFPGQEAIIDYHWSGKLNAPENRPFDAGWRAHHLVEWVKSPTYENGYVSFKATLLEEAVFEPQKGPCMNLALNANEAKEDGSHFAGWVMQPAYGNWNWDIDPPDVVATSCLLDTAAGTLTVRFPFHNAHEGQPSDYHITLWGFQNSDMVPTIYDGDHADPLGYARIRVP